MSTTNRHGTARRGSDDWSSAQAADRVLAWLADQPRDHGDIVVSFRGIADGSGTSLGTTRRAIRRLIDGGQLVLVRVGTGYPYSSRYRLASDLPAVAPVA